MNTPQRKSKNENLNFEEPNQQYIDKASHHIDKIGGLHRGFDLDKWLAVEAKIDQSLTEK